MENFVPGYDLRGLIENSLLEWENRVSAVLISGGCNWRCPFCHSWRYVTQLELLPPVPAFRVFDLLERQRGWLDGVVFSGGEPTLQSGLEDMIRRVRDYEVKIKLHSNGSRPEIIEKLLQNRRLDCLALDYKAPFSEEACAAAWGKALPGELERVRESFRLAEAAGSEVELEFHTTLVPGFVTPEGFKKMAADLPARGKWFLQQYRSGDTLNPAAAGATVYSRSQLDAFVKEAGLGARMILTGVE